MRTLLFFLITLPSLAAADEDFHFFALLNSGKVVSIEHTSYGEKWNGNLPIYRNKKVRQFSYCWASYDFENFYCSETRNKEHAVTYRKAPESGAAHDSAMNLAKRSIKLGELNVLQKQYYVCEQRCSSDTPRFIFFVADLVPCNIIYFAL